MPIPPEPLAPPIPDDPLTEPFWAGARKGELRIQRCGGCGTFIHVPRPVCRICRSFDLEWVAVSGRASLYSWTMVRRAFHPHFADRVPYPVGTVELVEQPHLHVLTLLVGLEPSDIVVGMDLQVTFEDRGDGVIIPVFCAVGAVT